MASSESTTSLRLGDAQTAVLDDPVWHALTTSHAHLAEGTGAARRYHPEVAAFVALDPSRADAWSALHELVGPGETVLLARHGGIVTPAEWSRVWGGFGFQMVLDRLAPAPPTDATITQLTDAHVEQMVALVELTRPGPFRPRTIELGDYFGVFDDGGQLIAMAGERLQTTEFTEISAVCTHPTARRRGLASILSSHVAVGILARGQRPILHVAETNTNARRVYERLGFAVRSRLEFVLVETPPAAVTEAALPFRHREAR
jgi:ribosomal protein S18 acetylase RimI-like enzyme